MRNKNKLKKNIQAIAIVTILLTLIIPTVIGEIDQITKPEDVKMKDVIENNLLLMGQETRWPPQAHEEVELLEPGLFEATVTQWHLNQTPPYELWKIPMGEIEGCIGVEKDMGIEVNFLSGTWDNNPFFENPIRLHATIKNGYINGQMLTGITDPIGEEVLYSARISGFYRVNHDPSEEDPGDFYLQLILQYCPGDYVVEGYYTYQVS